MTEYKLVPVEPTADMESEGMLSLCGSIGGYESGLVQKCWHAMLAAAPAVQGESDVARHDAMRLALSEMVKWYENIPLGNNPAFQYYNLAKKALLSAAPQPAERQPAPDESALVEALECMIIGACAVAVPHNGERAVLQDAVNIARNALTAHHRGGKSCTE